MAIQIEPTQIKESLYLLIPKNIAELIDAKKDTKFSLNVKQNGKHHVLEYEIK